MKKGKYHQKFCIMLLCNQVDHFCKLEIKELLTIILVLLQKWFLSTLKFYHLFFQRFYKKLIWRSFFTRLLSSDVKELHLLFSILLEIHIFPFSGNTYFYTILIILTDKLSHLHVLVGSSEFFTCHMFFSVAWKKIIVQFVL